jgi:hypothetical protein
MNSENPNFPARQQLQDLQSETPQKKQFTHKKIILIVAIAVIVIFAIALSGFDLQSKYSKHITGSKECISLVKKKEGSNFSGIHSLECTLTPRKIGNSSLTAQYLEYGGAPKDKGVCIDPGFTIPHPEESKYCVSFAGTVLSDGKMYQGVGDKNSATPIEYDYCYSSRLNLSSQPKPTKHDLYFYQGTLYDRDVFTKVDYKTPYGTCILNGTTLYHPGKSGNTEYVTNVKTDYSGFPKDCKTATIGQPADDFLNCAVLVTVANASLDPCHSNDTPIVANGKITGYKTESQVYVGQYTNGDCENAYVQRMAALNRCEDIASDKLRASCKPKVSQPFEDVTRVSGTL